VERAENLLKRLHLLDSVELREQWYIHFHREEGSRMSNKLMRLAIAYRVQELQYDTVQRCELIRGKAVAYRLGDNDLGRGRGVILKPGTRLLREHKGRMHEVLVIENGRYVYEGQICGSLSEVAWKITGSPRSGTMFFGLRKWRRRPTHG
jgi:hypothetical protein